MSQVMMENIRLNKSQLKKFKQMLSWYAIEEHDILVPEIMEYCDEHDIQKKDEMQFYVYLYGVHENRMVDTNDRVEQQWESIMMEQFDDAVQRCDYEMNGPYVYSPLRVPPQIDPPQMAPIGIRVSPICR
jgi:hypothetical protein